MPRYWRSTAQVCDFATQIETVIEILCARTKDAADEVTKTLPDNFPASVSEPILTDLTTAAEKLGCRTKPPTT